MRVTRSLGVLIQGFIKAFDLKVMVAGITHYADYDDLIWEDNDVFTVSSGCVYPRRWKGAQLHTRLHSHEK